MRINCQKTLEDECQELGKASLLFHKEKNSLFLSLSQEINDVLILPFLLRNPLRHCSVNIVLLQEQHIRSQCKRIPSRGGERQYMDLLRERELPTPPHAAVLMTANCAGEKKKSVCLHVCRTSQDDKQQSSQSSQLCRCAGMTSNLPRKAVRHWPELPAWSLILEADLFPLVCQMSWDACNGISVN